jgi:hypothetical protein
MIRSIESPQKPAIGQVLLYVPACAGGLIPYSQPPEQESHPLLPGARRFASAAWKPWR